MPDMPTALAKQPHGAEHIAPDAHGRNFYTIDRQFQDLLSLYLEPGLRAAMTPHFERLGALAGNRLDDLAMVADKHPPVLQPRDRFGRDEDWIDYHPAYREMEKIAFEDFGMHAMTHRAGVLGMAEPAHPLVKYGITYSFVQAESRQVRLAAAAGGRQPQQLPDRAAEGQARHALDGLGRDHPRRRHGLPRGRRDPGLQADDGAGQSLAAEPRRARGLDDAPLPQRGDGGGAEPPRLRPCHRRLSAAAPPIDEDHAADRTGAVDVRLLGRHDGPGERGRQARGQPAADAHTG